MKRVAELVGIKEGFLNLATRNRPSTRSDSQRQSLRVHKRFYVTLALHDLIREVSLDTVAHRYGASRGMLQSLQSSSSTFAGMVTVFCGKLGWHNMEMLLAQFQNRLSFGIERDLCELVRISTLNAFRARVLYNAGYHTIAAVASTSPDEIERRLRNATPFQSLKKSDGESDYELRRRVRAKCVWVQGRKALTEAEAAQEIVAEACQLLRDDALKLGVSWKPDTVISSTGQNTNLNNVSEKVYFETVDYIDKIGRKSSEILKPARAENDPRVNPDQDVTPSKPQIDASKNLQVTTSLNKANIMSSTKETRKKDKLNVEITVVQNNATMTSVKEKSPSKASKASMTDLSQIVSETSRIPLSKKETNNLVSKLGPSLPYSSTTSTDIAQTIQRSTSLSKEDPSSLSKTLSHPIITCTDVTHCTTSIQKSSVSEHSLSHSTITCTNVIHTTTAASDNFDGVSCSPSSFRKSALFHNKVSNTTKDLVNNAGLTRGLRSKPLQEKERVTPRKRRDSSLKRKHSVNKSPTDIYGPKVNLTDLKEPGEYPDKSTRQCVNDPPTSSDRGDKFYANCADNFKTKKRHGTPTKRKTEGALIIQSSPGERSKTSSLLSTDTRFDKYAQLKFDVKLENGNPMNQIASDQRLVTPAVSETKTPQSKQFERDDESPELIKEDEMHTLAAVKVPFADLEDKINTCDISPELFSEAMFPDCQSESFEMQVDTLPESSGFDNFEISLENMIVSPCKLENEMQRENNTETTIPTGEVLISGRAESKITDVEVYANKMPGMVRTPGRLESKISVSEVRTPCSLSEDFVDLAGICSGMFDSEMRLSHSTPAPLNNNQSRGARINPQDSPKQSSEITRQKSQNYKVSGEHGDGKSEMFANGPEKSQTSPEKSSASSGKSSPERSHATFDSFSLRLSQSFDCTNDSDLRATLADVTVLEEDAARIASDKRDQNVHLIGKGHWMDDHEHFIDNHGHLKDNHEHVTGKQDHSIVKQKYLEDNQAHLLDNPQGPPIDNVENEDNPLDNQDCDVFQDVSNMSLQTLAAIEEIDKELCLNHESNSKQEQEHSKAGCEVLSPTNEKRFTEVKDRYCQTKPVVHTDCKLHRPVETSVSQVRKSLNTSNFLFDIIDVCKDYSTCEEFVEDCKSNSFTFSVALEKDKSSGSRIGRKFNKGGKKHVPGGKQQPRLVIEEENLSVLGVAVCFDDARVWFLSLEEGTPAKISWEQRMHCLQRIMESHVDGLVKIAFGMKDQYKVSCQPIFSAKNGIIDLIGN